MEPVAAVAVVVAVWKVVVVGTPMWTKKVFVLG